jgi:putative AbiEii toxin of type IV toxin-antitoxin system
MFILEYNQLFTPFAMKFNFKNIGIVKQAEIELNGLTIITGLNDTGKSFLSKAIFSIIKTPKEAVRYFDYQKVENLSSLINIIWSYHRQVIPFTPEKLQQFNPSAFPLKINSTFIENKTSVAELRQTFVDYKKIIEFDYENATENVKAIINQRQIATQTQNLFTAIFARLDENIDFEGKARVYFEQMIIFRLFENQINTVSKDGLTLDIKVSEGVSSLLNLSVEANRIRNFKYDNVLLVNDATLIETPAILPLTKFIDNALASGFRNLGALIPTHFEDLFSKIRLYTGKIPSEYLPIASEIADIIGGRFSSTPEDGIFFAKGDAKIKPNNIASGIKSFIFLLISLEFINKNSLLIIDEPEVHLHPKWEIEYARIIASLTKLGVPILVSSHSPYLIRALAKYSEEFEIEKKTNFYFGKKDKDGYSTFDNVSEDLEPIFEALAIPMQSLS